MSGAERPAQHAAQPPGGLAAAIRRQFVLASLAVGFLTRLPMPSVRGFAPSMLAGAALYFPLVGALVGAIGVLAWAAARTWLPDGIAAGIAMAASLLLTGAFHEDGFADACDGFGGGNTRERVLEIMKDSRIGAFGAIGIFMMLGLKWLALIAIPAASFALAVIAAHALSRWCACALIVALRYVRDGDTKSKPVVESSSLRSWAFGGVLAAAAVLIGFRALGAWPMPSQWRMLCVASAAAVLVAAAAALYFRRRIGGYTGDCLGAAQQLGELAFLLGAVGFWRAAGP